MRVSRFLALGASLYLVASSGGAPLQPAEVGTPPAPPVAPKKPHQVPSPNGAREDDYYWLRDDTRRSPDVLGYLNAENAYRDAVMAPTRALQQRLYAEITARLKPDDSSVPVHEHGYWYYTRFEPGRDYPLYARRKDAPSAREELMLDGNAMAKGHEFFHVGSAKASPDGKLLAYTEDYVG
ncbi:MAG: S9 family peptidase, partial [Gammaproteobacteria bacterium]|nr:S9 family peptidase [Gammaproteobacteria bacterium]